MSFVIRLEASQKYLTRKNIQPTWSEDINKARLFGRVQDTKATLDTGDASFEGRWAHNRLPDGSGPIQIEVVELIMTPGDVVKDIVQIPKVDNSWSTSFNINHLQADFS